MFDVSLQQLRRGSPGTARAGFRQFLQDYAEHPLAGDAWFFLGEAWEEENGDSATVGYQEVVDRYPDSRRAPDPLDRCWNIGLFRLPSTYRVKPQRHAEGQINPISYLQNRLQKPA